MYGGGQSLQGPLAYLERTTSNIGGPIPNSMPGGMTSMGMGGGGGSMGGMGGPGMMNNMGGMR